MHLQQKPGVVLVLTERERQCAGLGFRLDDCLEAALDAAANGEDLEDEGSDSEDGDLMEVGRGGVFCVSGQLFVLH